MVAVMPSAAAGLGAHTARLPEAHFKAALGFLVAAAIALPLIAPDLAAGRFLMPRVVATTHLLTLGWITMSIMGALCQLFPVVLGVPLRWRRGGWLGLALFAPGLAVFVASMPFDASLVSIVAAAFFASGLLLFAANAIATLRTVSAHDVTWWALALAVGFLIATVAFGVSLALNLETGHLGAERLRAMSVHVHVALGGWVLLVMVAVGRRLLPMFLLSHGTAEHGWKRAFGLLAAGAGILTLSHGYLNTPVLITSALLLAAGAGVFVFTAISQFRGRRRPALDAGLRLAGAGVLLLAAAIPTGLALLLPGAGAPRHITAYGVALIPGGFTLFVLGHYYKIVPFLTWTRVYGDTAGRVATPKVSELYDARIAGISAAFASGGIVLLVIAVAVGSALAARLGAAAFSLGAIGAATQLGMLLWKRNVE